MRYGSQSIGKTPCGTRLLMCLIVVAVAPEPLLKSQVLTRAELKLLLPRATPVSGVVVDASGNPIRGARVDHSARYYAPLRTWWGTHGRESPITDSSGRFSITTRAPALVIRKAGYRSVRVQVHGRSALRVTLHEITNAFPSVREGTNCETLDGWHTLFCFPKRPQIVAVRPFRDIDFRARTIVIRTEAGPKEMMHGVGPDWSSGVPNNEEVWGSVTYGESVYNYGNFELVDARGSTAGGNVWRYFGRKGESAEYRDVDAAAARLFDQIIDGVCIQ